MIFFLIILVMAVISDTWFDRTEEDFANNLVRLEALLTFEIVVFNALITQEILCISKFIPCFNKRALAMNLHDSTC